MIKNELYNNMSHFVFYPKLESGQFFSLSEISYDEVLKKSKVWNRVDPLIESSELSRLHDLTDNDIIVR